MTDHDGGGPVPNGDVPEDRLPERKVIPVVREEAAVTKRRRRTGSVKVRTRVREETQRIAIPLVRESVDIQRVPVGREVSVPPPVRTDGDRVIVPVLEEELIVSKRLVLREEIHLIRRHAEEIVEEDVPVRREEVEIQRLDAEGEVL